MQLFATMWTSLPRITHVSVPNTWLIFNLHRESFFIKHSQIHIITIPRMHVICKQRKTLTWKDGLLFMVGNPIFSGLLLEVNCPLPPCFPSPPQPVSPAHLTFFYIQPTLTCQLLHAGHNSFIRILK
jgi:hypothetical protein